MRTPRKLFLLLLTCCCCLTTFATVNVQVNGDGTRFTSVLYNGSSTLKYDIVFVGDGFTSSATDQTRFNNAVLSAVDALRHKEPYATNLCGFNVWRVNVISAQSGVDHPVTGVSKNTELNCTFGDNISQPERVIFSTTPPRVTEAANFAPAYEAVYVLVNDEQYGGAAGDIVYTSLNTSMQEVVVHELGHFVGHLADEYPCYFCDGRAEPPYSGPEPDAVNLTLQTNRAAIKWKNFIQPATPLPTTVNTPAGVVGLWAGGGYSPTGIYRPQQDCLMRALNLELCAVCSGALTNILHPTCTACERAPGSLACMLSQLRKKFYVYKPKIIRIPECCFCPLGLDSFEERMEITLSINTKQYAIEVITADGKKVDATVRDTDKGATISFAENTNVAYFLSIAPLQTLNEAAPVDVTLARGGKQVAL
ncbi:M64 family metallopeptidase [Chryseolinea lacunae]|uniref:Peptidase M43 pregnancy-associated plasma-A domain-containing protein n=1 Tax=Chryseolinea lacunae TaxID=2801331 RepID=A0ABS1KVV2_9BACT|nr:M64 family metallopeptidase [Chryseolinea lacunae]MBL0743438.1 hypothetical protein [Chryseolinea lacunae]